MARIIVNFHMFDKQQEILVYENGECITGLHPYLSDIVETTRGLMNEYDINQITLCGNPNFAKKYKEKLQTQFSNVSIDIVKH